ncbi:MAG TPA: hypothetical protein PLJ00_07395 [Chitinophagales bacterium]|nr:hypothetical protein [Chitinophagales bacterium]HRG84412.1 hypothetical protein [Chitinophagales bacterium]HRH53039.1 hypothetical protein [Chitinophagales bacterium]
MNRRKFIKNSLLTTAGMISAPYILPAGTLFRSSGARLANHVVLVVFGGGIRNQESVEQQYLINQGAGPTGNIMRNMLNGASPASNLVYDIWDPVTPSPLVTKGTLFKHMKYASGPTGHFNGHTAVITGNYTPDSLNLYANPATPTLFEYYRKHNDPQKTALNAWWMSIDLGPYVNLNYSLDKLYGSQYGANYLSPQTTFGGLGIDYFSTLNTMHPEELARLNSIKSFLNSNFNRSVTDIPGINNTEDDKQAIQDFVLKVIKGEIPIEWPLPPGVGFDQLSGDLSNVAISWKVLQQFHPELMVINTTNLDICHTNFSEYISYLHRADYGVGWLWQKIQSDPVLANDTIMICVPEHGRNQVANAIPDANGLFAYDHTGDDNSRSVFSLIVGPPSVVKQNLVVGSEEDPIGETIDIVPTIAHILGFKDSIPSGYLPGNVLEQAFV